MAGTLEDVAWNLDPLVDGEGEAGVDRLLKEAQDRSAGLRRALPGQRVEHRRRRARRGRRRAASRSPSSSGKAGTYAMLRFATDTADPANGALLQRVQEQATVVETRLVFFELEWAELDDARVDELLAADGLDTARHYLRTIRRYRPHLLTEPEEKLMSEKARHGPRRLDAPVLRAHQRGRGDARRRDPGARRRAGQADVARPRAARARPAGGHRRAAADAAHARVRLQHADGRQVDRRPAAQLPDLDLEPQPRQRGQRRVRPGTRRRRPRRLRHPAALVPAQGAAARRRAPQGLRPHGPGGRRGRVVRVGPGQADRP